MFRNLLYIVDCITPFDNVYICRKKYVILTYCGRVYPVTKDTGEMRTKFTKSGHHVWLIPAIEKCTKLATPERKKLTVSKILLQYVRMDPS